VSVTGAQGAEALEQHDAAELAGQATLNIEAGEKGAHLLIVEMEGKGEDSRFS